MRARLITLLYNVQNSYWFIPMCMMIGSIALALLMRWLDEVYSSSGLPWTMAASVDDARTLLGTMATSILGVAGVTFSITMVVVSFAGSNFGPRLINNFMRDRGSQYTLGTFIATFVYCLTVLTNVQGSVQSKAGVSTEAFVPHLSVSVAMLASIVSVSFLIYFIHHVTETINIENIVAHIGSTLEQRIGDQFPAEPIASDDLPLLEDEDFEAAIHGKVIHEVSSNCIGYIQTIDLTELTSVAANNDLLVRVHYRTGDFTCTHDCLLTVWTDTAGEIPEDALRACFTTGRERTEFQNILFLVEQLSEVIARALSPGINDPYTAISCLNWFRVALMEYLHCPPENAPDSEQAALTWSRSRIQFQPLTLERLCTTMFDQTRQYIAADRNVTQHTLSLLCECAWAAGPGRHRDLLLDHMSRLHAASLRGLGESGELESVSNTYRQAQEIIAQTNGLDQIRKRTAWFGGSA